MKRLSIIIFTVLLVGCKKEPDVLPTDDNELITTVELVFTDQSNTVKRFKFKDIDGDSRTPPEAFDTLKLARNTDYSVEIHLADESKGPIDDITESIKEESDVHLFVYRPKPVSLLAMQITDTDKNALPIGLTAKAKTQYFPGTGVLQVLLKHQPPLNGKIVKTGDEEAGSTDLDLTFPVIIK